MKTSTFLPLHRNSFSKEEEKEVILQQERDVITTDIDRVGHNSWAKKLFARSVEVRGVVAASNFGFVCCVQQLITCQVYRQCPRTNGSDTRTAKLFLCGSL